MIWVNSFVHLGIFVIFENKKDTIAALSCKTSSFLAAVTMLYFKTKHNVSSKPHMKNICLLEASWVYKSSAVLYCFNTHCKASCINEHWEGVQRAQFHKLTESGCHSFQLRVNEIQWWASLISWPTLYLDNREQIYVFFVQRKFFILIYTDSVQ